MPSLPRSPVARKPLPRSQALSPGIASPLSQNPPTPPHFNSANEASHEEALPWVTTKSGAVSSTDEHRRQSPSRQSASSPPLPTLCTEEPPSKRSPRWLQYCNETLWLPEVLSYLVSVLALVAIVILLVTHQGKPLPNWPALVSVNSLVAIFTSIMKAALLYPIAEGIGELKWIWFAHVRPLSDFDRFDYAARSPWGALMLLVRNPMSILTSLAAVISIVALAIDPFTQQILQYYTCLTPTPGIVASVPRTNFYLAAGQHQSPEETSLDGPMTVAVYEGLINPPANASANVAFNCQSGNCAIAGNDQGVYYSLAMCYVVTDLTHSLNETGQEKYDKNYTLPSGASASAFGGAFLGTGFGDSALASGDIERAWGFDFDVVMLRTDCPGNNNPESSECGLSPFAFGAHLQPCIQAYSSGNINNFVLSEKPGSSVNLVLSFIEDEVYFSLAGNYPSFPGQDCTPSDKPQGNKTAMALPTGDGQHVYVQNSTQITPNSSTVYFDPGCVYMYGAASTQALHEVTPAFFGPEHGLFSPDEDPTNADGNIWLERLYMNGTANMSTVNVYMQGFANAVTAVIRKNGAADHSAPASGSVLGAQTCIAVEWAWLALPAFLLAATLFFMVATGLRSRHVTLPSTLHGGREPGRRPWKSSALPLLWCGLPDHIRQSYAASDSVDEMKASGNQLFVTLRRTTEGVGALQPGTIEGTAARGRWILAEGTHKA